MVKQIKLLRYQYGIRQIQFYDDTFTVMKKHVLDFCQRLIDEKVDVTWTAYIRGDCFSEDMAAMMKKAGCHQVLIGIESADKHVLRLIQKPINKERYKQTVKTAHDHGLEVRGSFIIGCPGETPDSMRATLHFSKELDIDLFQLNILTPYPGTQVYREALEKNLLLHTDWDFYGQGRVIMDNPNLPAEEIYKFEKYALRSFYLRPRQILRQLKRITSFRHIRDLFMGLYTMLLGNLMYKNPDWKCWLNLEEEDFLDIKLHEPKLVRLTYELRQGNATFSTAP